MEHTNHSVGIHKVRVIPTEVAQYLNLPDYKNYTGHALRRTRACLLASETAWRVEIFIRGRRICRPVAGN